MLNKLMDLGRWIFGRTGISPALRAASAGLLEVADARHHAVMLDEMA
jgi:hypothetical protein